MRAHLLTNQSLVFSVFFLQYFCGDLKNYDQMAKQRVRYGSIEEEGGLTSVLEPIYIRCGCAFMWLCTEIVWNNKSYRVAYYPERHHLKGENCSDIFLSHIWVQSCCTKKRRNLAQSLHRQIEKLNILRAVGSNALCSASVLTDTQVVNASYIQTFPLVVDCVHNVQLQPIYTHWQDGPAFTAVLTSLESKALPSTETVCARHTEPVDTNCVLTNIIKTTLVVTRTAGFVQCFYTFNHSENIVFLRIRSEEMSDSVTKVVQVTLFTLPYRQRTGKRNVSFSSPWYTGQYASTHVLNLISDIVSISLSQPNTTSWNKSVQITFSHVFAARRNHIPQCVFWDKVSHGWSGQGCLTLSTNSSHTRCQCGHLSSFAVLVNVARGPDIVDSTPQVVLSYMGSLASCVCLLLTCFTFRFFANLKSARNSVHAHLAACLLCSHVLYMIGAQVRGIVRLCNILSILMHYTLLCSVNWMVVEGIVLYCLFLQPFRYNRFIKSSRNCNYVHVCCYVMPLLIILLTALAFQRPYNGDGYCWLNVRNGAIWTFAGPLVCMVFVNSGALGVVLFIMLSHSLSSKAMQHRSGLSKLSLWAKGTAMMVTVLGLFWIIGLFDVNQDTAIFSYLFILCNSTQGVFIFVLNCAFNEAVLGEYRRHLLKLDFLPAFIKSSLTQGQKFRRKSMKRRKSMMKENMSTFERQRVDTLHILLEGLDPLSESEETSTVEDEESSVISAYSVTSVGPVAKMFMNFTGVVYAISSKEKLRVSQESIPDLENQSSDSAETTIHESDEEDEVIHELGNYNRVHSLFDVTVCPSDEDQRDTHSLYELVKKSARDLVVTSAVTSTGSMTGSHDLKATAPDTEAVTPRVPETDTSGSPSLTRKTEAETAVNSDKLTETKMTESVPREQTAKVCDYNREPKSGAMNKVKRKLQKMPFSRLSRPFKSSGSKISSKLRAKLRVLSRSAVKKHRQAAVSLSPEKNPTEGQSTTNDSSAKANPSNGKSALCATLDDDAKARSPQLKTESANENDREIKKCEMEASGKEAHSALTDAKYIRRFIKGGDDDGTLGLIPIDTLTTNSRTDQTVHAESTGLLHPSTFLVTSQDNSSIGLIQTEDSQSQGTSSTLQQSQTLGLPQKTTANTPENSDTVRVGQLASTSTSDQPAGIKNWKRDLSRLEQVKRDTSQDSIAEDEGESLAEGLFSQVKQWTELVTQTAISDEQRRVRFALEPDSGELGKPVVRSQTPARTILKAEASLLNLALGKTGTVPHVRGHIKKVKKQKSRDSKKKSKK